MRTDGWYLLREGETTGPYSEQQVGQMMEDGEIAECDRLARAGGRDWISAREVERLLNAAPPMRARRVDRQRKHDPARWSSWAMAGMVCGIMGFMPCPFIGGILGVIFAMLAINEGDERHGKIALWTSIGTTATLLVLYLILFISMPHMGS